MKNTPHLELVQSQYLQDYHLQSTPACGSAHAKCSADALPHLRGFSCTAGFRVRPQGLWRGFSMAKLWYRVESLGLGCRLTKLAGWFPCVPSHDSHHHHHPQKHNNNHKHMRWPGLNRSSQKYPCTRLAASLTKLSWFCSMRGQRRPIPQLTTQGMSRNKPQEITMLPPWPGGGDADRKRRRVKGVGS